MTGQYIVCEIKEHTPINGADKIVSSNIFGETVIISKETPIGTKGILIDLEAVLDKNLVSNLNMFRDPKLNQDKVSKGYIEENCRVRPISLKGTKCSGLFLSEEQLYKLGINLPKLGTEGTTIGNIKICEKYIAKATRSVMNSNKGGSIRQNLVPTFKEHIDTCQWARESHKVQEGDLVIITEKLHGTCMLPSQRVLMADGSYKQISTIKKGDYVLGFDHNTNYTVPSKVLKTWNHGKNEDTWQLVKFSRDGLLGNSYGTIYSTKEHEFYVNGKYLPAKDIKTDDILTILRTDYEIEDFQKQVLIGKFLGDGSIKIRDHSFAGKMTFGHSIHQLDYLKYCNECLSDISYVDNNEYTSGYGSKIYRCHTKDIAFISEYFSQFIIDGKRKLNNSIIKDLNPIAFAFLYMDDGSLSNIENQNYRADLALCNFDKESCEIIQKGLLKFGINSTIYDSSGYRIRMNFKDASIFYNLIAPYVPLSMQYKLPESLRGYTPYVPKSINKLTTYIFKSKVIESIDTKEKSIRGMSSKIDITTETSNFFAGGVLVHNSGRCGYLPTDTTTRIPKWKLFLDKLLWGKQAFYRSYEFVVGSRRVVKSIGGNEAENKQHFYDEDLWTKVAKENFEGKLRKGETCYFEIVGHAPSGELIMSSVANAKLKNFMNGIEYQDFLHKYGDITTFSYGCTKDGYDDLYTKNDPYKIFVYRITLTNEDGDSIDYSWEQVKRRCEQLGVNHVPELYRTYIPYPTDCTKTAVDYAKNYIQEKVQNLTDSESKNFPQHIREGVVVRVENGNMIPLFLKSKSFIFKVLDSIIKDSDIVDMEDSQK